MRHALFAIEQTSQAQLCKKWYLASLKSMNKDTIKRLRDLSAQAQNERDSEKLMAIIREIERIIVESEEEGVPKIANGPAGSGRPPGGTSSET